MYFLEYFLYYVRPYGVKTSGRYRIPNHEIQQSQPDQDNNKEAGGSDQNSKKELDTKEETKEKDTQTGEESAKAEEKQT